jgi:hypothetical protein
VSLSRLSRTMPSPSRTKRDGRISPALLWRLFRQAGRCHFGHMRSALLLRQAVPVLPGLCFQLAHGGVSRLLLGGGPSAVLGRIGAVVVYPVNRVLFGRASAHVGKEVRIGVAPSLTHDNPAATVASEVVVPAVVAAGLHAFPNFVLSRCFTYCALAMNFVRAGLAVLPLRAATRFNSARAKVASRSHSRSATVATTQPLFSDHGKNGEITEPLSSQIQWNHKMILTRVCDVAL